MVLRDLIQMIDIEEYISQFVDLEEKNGEFWGLSPFKEEKTPSFSVRKETSSFYDFSSGIGGNVFTFVKHYNKCSGREAVEILKQYLGGDIGLSNNKRLTATSVCKRYKKVEKNKKKKLSKITIYPSNYMEKYEKCDAKLQEWENEGISRESMDKFEVYYDKFSDRIVYPIRNFDGDIVNVSGRIMDKEWKEKGLRKYTYFSGWGEMDIMYGLYDNLSEILSKKEIIVFEGCKSVLLADTWGFHNTSALLTSHLNPSQMKLLASLGVRVVFALDKDVDIKKDHNIGKLKRYVNVEYLIDTKDLLDKKDAPVDKGLDIFKELYENRRLYR